MKRPVSDGSHIVCSAGHVQKPIQFDLSQRNRGQPGMVRRQFNRDPGVRKARFDGGSGSDVPAAGNYDRCTRSRGSQFQCFADGAKRLRRSAADFSFVDFGEIFRHQNYIEKTNKKKKPAKIIAQKYPLENRRPEIL